MPHCCPKPWGVYRGCWHASDRTWPRTRSFRSAVSVRARPSVCVAYACWPTGYRQPCLTARASCRISTCSAAAASKCCAGRSRRCTAIPPEGYCSCGVPMARPATRGACAWPAAATTAAAWECSCAGRRRPCTTTWLPTTTAPPAGANTLWPGGNRSMRVSASNWARAGGWISPSMRWRHRRRRTRWAWMPNRCAAIRARPAPWPLNTTRANRCARPSWVRSMPMSWIRRAGA